MVEPGPPNPWRLRRLQRGVRPNRGAGENAGVVDIVVGSPTQIVIYQRKSGDDLGKWLNSCPIHSRCPKPDHRMFHKATSSNIVFPLIFHYISTVLRVLPAIFFRPNPPNTMVLSEISNLAVQDKDQRAPSGHDPEGSILR